MQKRKTGRDRSDPHAVYCRDQPHRTSGRSGTDGIFFKRKEKNWKNQKIFFGNGPGAVSGETGTSVRGAFEADERSKKIVQKRSQERDHARDAVAKASQLLKSFVQLEDAEKTLQSLKEQEEAITEQQELAVRVEDAWEVQAVYQRLLDCKKMLEKLRSDLQEQTEQLPNLMEDTKLCIQNTKDAKHQQEEEVAAFTKVEEKVKKAMEVFTKWKSPGRM